jgi:uncharacterized membrane protein
MPSTREPAPDRAFVTCVAMAVAFFLVCTATSWARWANFEYRTFDVAYYIQAIWQLIHGRFEVSVQHVPLLGNHVEPIMFLFAPLFAVFRHPMLFVVVQNAALATMAPVGFSIATRLGLPRRAAALLALALLVTPAAGFIALHEFHPETLTAPFLLLMLHARVTGSLRWHLLWFTATLACKENMALLLAAYCVVHLILERSRPARELRSWYVWPLAAAVAWFVICTKVITPALNSGDIDYLALYDRLGGSAGSIVLNAFREPQRAITTLVQATTGGNLIWGLLLPFVALPLLRPRWILIASPVLMQHLLSWRSSEWMIYFHYAAPLLPLFWIAMVEFLAHRQTSSSRFPIFLRNALPALVVLACVAAQALLGPSAAIAATAGRWSASKEERTRKAEFMGAIPPNASVMAPLPYLSHLAMREQLYSLHYTIKGLKTLSRAAYEAPPPTDYVLLDYNDDATFDAAAGYYHPAMKTVDGRVIPSSEQLLHNFLKSASWSSISRDELTLLRREASAMATQRQEAVPSAPVQLLRMTAALEEGVPAHTLRVTGEWRFHAERAVFPWMLVTFVPKVGTAALVVTRGLVAPEATAGTHHDVWTTDTPSELPDGDYMVEAIFVDNSQRAWRSTKGDQDLTLPALLPAAPLGEMHIAGSHRSFVAH